MKWNERNTKRWTAAASSCVKTLKMPIKWAKKLGKMNTNKLIAMQYEIVGLTPNRTNTHTHTYIYTYIHSCARATQNNNNSNNKRIDLKLRPRMKTKQRECLKYTLGIDYSACESALKMPMAVFWFHAHCTQLWMYYECMGTFDRTCSNSN